ncbi:MAG: hypothetical protein ABNH16_06910 [Thalassolituus sp.]|jgi:hypothetical protein
MLNNYPAIITAPQRWVTEVSPSGAVRHVQKISHHHLVIRLEDLPNLLMDKLIVSDEIAEQALKALVGRG